MGVYERLTPAQIDTEAKRIASASNVDRWSLAALIARSGIPAEVARQATYRSGIYGSQAAIDVGRSLADVLVSKIMDPDFADTRQFADGASFSGWMRQTGFRLAPTLIRRERRRFVAARPTDPTELIEHGVGQAEQPDRDVERALLAHALDTRSVGPLERLHADALALSTTLGIPMLPATRRPVATRAHLLALLDADPELPSKIAADLAAAAASPHDSVMVEAISTLDFSAVALWAQAQPRVTEKLARAAFSPMPPPAEAVVTMLCDAIVRHAEGNTELAALGQKLVRGWARAIADLSTSEFSATGAKAKTDAEIAGDVGRFARLAQRYADLGGIPLGRSVHEIHQTLSANLRRAVRHRRLEAEAPFVFKPITPTGRRFHIVPPLAG